jgi:hypothetical protein
MGTEPHDGALRRRPNAALVLSRRALLGVWIPISLRQFSGGCRGVIRSA